MITPIHSLPEPANQNYCEAIVMLKKPSVKDKIVDALFGFVDYDSFLVVTEASHLDRSLIAYEYAQAILDIIGKDE